MSDPYCRLRPQPETPFEELCSCSDRPPIKLMEALGANPIHCMRCNLEVAPESITLPHSLVDHIADWNQIQCSIDRLWLDSGTYEEWAYHELTEPSSSTNINGLKLREVLNRHLPCYYWLHIKSGTRECPRCNSGFIPYEGSKIEQVICTNCGIVADPTGPFGAP
jgi:predicted  nucleic acid-binding Zn ribbon protein